MAKTGNDDLASASCGRSRSWRRSAARRKENSSAELTRDAEGVRAGTELVEIKAVWLLLINLLRRWRRAGR